ncbi:MAG: polysaccharide deacetylase family protein [Sphingobacteriaceae bacterium]|nr:MAG: polysaccharide deacetylase family protein [Sphingobacteriaceae bacterium]
MTKSWSVLFLLLLLSTTNLFAQNNKTVVLTFDDAPQSHYSFVAPLLKQLGFGATFYVCEFPGVSPDSTKAMNWRQIAQLSHMGFEIGNHTRTHTLLKAINETAELGYVESKLDSLGVPRPTSYAYPGYVVDSSSFAVLKKHGYTSARIGGDKPYNIKADNAYLIPSFSIQDGVGDLFYKAVQQAEKGKIIILTFHGVPDLPHPWVSMDQAVFRTYMQYLKDNHYKVIAMRDLKLAAKK